MTINIFREFRDDQPKELVFEHMKPVKNPDGSIVKGKFAGTGEHTVLKRFSSQRIWVCAPESWTQIRVLAELKKLRPNEGWAVTREQDPFGNGNPCPCNQHLHDSKHHYFEIPEQGAL